ncbi:H-NS family nucleoid-associated regulatory protein [Paludibacterium yongneupense]|uniref:H-NS family nucleoid-associated regulatory protein n=1 Tax=Paludibacterium yongneupense TaxID=400061 RepID=UPI00041314CB|nr:H-NS family nucleoid-associated regulatory protein [Paludibacterium yongneupense]
MQENDDPYVVNDLFGMEEAALLDLEDGDEDRLVAGLGIAPCRMRYDEQALAEEKRDSRLAIAKYRCKSNPALTWGGRGRPPRWVVWYLDSGGRLSDLAI